MQHCIRAIACAIAFAALLAAPRAAQACSICLAGDPAFDTHGATALQQGDVSVYFEVSGWTKKSGELPGGHHAEEEEPDAEHEEPGVEENDSQKLDLYVSWSPLDRFTVTLNVPVAFNEITEFGHEGAVRRTHDGFGDIALSTSTVLWRSREILPDTWVEGRTFLKFPTGQSRQTVGGVRDKHLQAGTGSWDFGFGLAGVHKFEWGTTYASVFGRVNTEGSLDYEYGDVVLANVAALLPLGHATGLTALDRFTLGAELNYRWADYDDFSGVRFVDSGGSILYATPSLRIQLPWIEGQRAPSVRTGVQVPLTSKWLNGFQVEGERWTVGLHFPI